MAFQSVQWELSSDSPVVVKISNPIKRNDPDVHISYSLSVQTTLSTYSAKTFEIQRRFKDFTHLFYCLSLEHPECILPPLPSKHRLDYPDRFSTAFTLKRIKELSTFINAITQHPMLVESKSLYTFLTSSLYPHNRKDSVVERMSEVVMNVLSKVKQPDQKFVDLCRDVENVQLGLESLQKVSSKYAKHKSEYAESISEMKVHVVALSGLESGISKELREFVKGIDSYHNALLAQGDVGFDEFLLLMIGYMQSCRNVLELRDQKQVDHETLNGYLFQAESEKEHSTNPGSGSIRTFLRVKLEDLKGLDHEMQKQQRIEKLTEKVNRLKLEVTDSKVVLEQFSQVVVGELNYFGSKKAEIYKEQLEEYVDAQIKCFENGAQAWEGLLARLE